MADREFTDTPARLVGYARVSSDGQDTALQIDALRRHGVAVIAEEKAGAGSLARPVLEVLLASLQPGQTLVVYKIDRLARSLFDLLSVIRRLESVGASLRSLTEPIDTSTPLGELVLQILGAIAQFELALIRERVRAGKAAAVGRGVVFGRRRRMDYGQLIALRAGGASWAQVGEALGVSDKTARSAFYRLRDGRARVEDPRGAAL